jgi:exopolysaccharide production protein ExoZ
VVLIFGGAMLLVSGDALQWGGGGAGFGATCVVLGALNARISQWRSALFRALGDSSYSLYLTHIFTLGVLRVVWGQLSPEITSVSAWIFLILSLGVSAAVGWVVYKYVEMPLTRRWH